MYAAGIDSQVWRQHAWVNRLQSLVLLLFSAVTINWFAIVLLIFAPTLSALAQLALARTLKEVMLGDVSKLSEFAVGMHRPGYRHV